MHTVTARQTPESVLCKDAEQPCAVQAGGSWMCISDAFMIIISSGWEIGIINPVGLYFIYFKSVYLFSGPGLKPFRHNTLDTVRETSCRYMIKLHFAALILIRFQFVKVLDDSARHFHNCFKTLFKS